MKRNTLRIAVLMLAMLASALGTLAVMQKASAGGVVASRVAAQPNAANAAVKYRSMTRSNLSGDPNSVAFDSGLVGYWKFDEGSGTAATDSSGNGNTGTLMNGPAFTTTVPATGFSDAYSLLLNGTNQFVTVPDASTLKPMTVTVAAWVKFNSLTTNTVCGLSPSSAQYIVFKRNSRIGQFHGYTLIYGYGGLTFGVDSAGGDQSGAYFAITPVLGRWYHLVGVFARPEIRLYVDGVRKGTALHDFPLDYGTRPVFIGRTGECGGAGEANWDSYFNGLVDDVRIYNRALTSVEIARLAGLPLPTLFLPLILR